MKPYSVKSLADRWDCSESHVRKLIRSGQLRAFTLGSKLFRVSAEEVEKWEKAQNLSGIEENSPSASSKMDSDSAVRLARLTLPSGVHDLRSLNASGRYKA